MGRPSGRESRCPALPDSKPSLVLRCHEPDGALACREAVACACGALRELGSDVTGIVWRHADVSSRHLAATRDVWVYLPPGYDPLAPERYPVLYLHDGNNLFSAATAFLGREWQADETAEWLITAGWLPPLILVGVGNTVNRLDEYTWVPSGGCGGGGERYMSFLREELMPFIDGVYATRGGREATGTLGSSLGGLAALYLGAYAGDTFGLVGAMSPSLWWAGGRALSDLAAIRSDLRLWLDMGDREGDATDEWETNVGYARALAATLARRGYQEGRTAVYHEVVGGTHDEAAWGERLAAALMFLWGGEPPARPTSSRVEGRAGHM